MNYFLSQATFLTKADKLPKQPNLTAYDICKFLYETVKEIPNTHAFYVGLYYEYINQIGFPYTCDEDNWVIADYRPLNNGPSSWVVKNRKPFILTGENIEQHQSGSHFGNTTKPSKSALHYPMFANDSSKNSILVGVISMQSYVANNYADEAEIFFETVARKAGELFLPFIEVESVKSLHEKLAEQTNVSNQYLDEITEEIDGIKKLIKRNVPSSEILNQLEILSNHCKEIQSTMIVRKHPISSLKEKMKLELWEKLTASEKKVVEKLLESKENKAIATALKISHESVKTHIKNACLKLDIKNGREGLYNFFNTKNK